MKTHKYKALQEKMSLTSDVNCIVLLTFFHATLLFCMLLENKASIVSIPCIYALMAYLHLYIFHCSLCCCLRNLRLFLNDVQFVKCLAKITEISVNSAVYLAIFFPHQNNFVMNIFQRAFFSFFFLLVLMQLHGMQHCKSKVQFTSRGCIAGTFRL